VQYVQDFYGFVIFEITASVPSGIAGLNFRRISARYLKDSKIPHLFAISFKYLDGLRRVYVRLHLAHCECLYE